MKTAVWEDRLKFDLLIYVVLFIVAITQIVFFPATTKYPGEVDLVFFAVFIIFIRCLKGIGNESLILLLLLCFAFILISYVSIYSVISGEISIYFLPLLLFTFGYPLLKLIYYHSDLTITGDEVQKIRDLVYPWALTGLLFFFFMFAFLGGIYSGNNTITIQLSYIISNILYLSYRTKVYKLNVLKK